MVYFFIVLVLTTSLNISHADSYTFERQIVVEDSTASNAIKDSAVSSDVNQEALQAYQEILEKTNQQLSLWWNPFGLMIAGLGVLFTILTIIAAAIIYFQGRGAKQLLNESIERHTQILNEYIEQKNEEMKGLIASYSQELDTLKEQAPDSEKSEDYLKKLQLLEKKLNAVSKKLDSSESDFSINRDLKLKVDQDTLNRLNRDLKVDKDAFDNFFLQRTVSLNPDHTCSKCEHRFTPSFQSRSLTGTNPVACPNCGNVDKI